MSDTLVLSLKFLISPPALWITILSFLIGIVLNIWIENRFPGMPRTNLTLNRWRNAWSEIRAPRTEEDWSLTLSHGYRRVIDIGFDIAKWILTIVALRALAKTSGNQLVSGLAATLTALIGIYCAFLLNRWLNYFLYFEYSNRWLRRAMLVLAFYNMLLITRAVNEVMKETADSLLSPPETEKAQPERKDWSDWRRV